MSTENIVRLALPGKGALEAATLAFLAECGMKVSRSNPRQYIARIGSMPDLEVVTAGGLVFIAATPDEKIRAFDKTNGRILWEAKLEAGGYATPSTYRVNGKQYVVIAAGGGGQLATKPGDAFIAFNLPD